MGTAVTLPIAEFHPQRAPWATIRTVGAVLAVHVVMAAAALWLAPAARSTPAPEPAMLYVVVPTTAPAAARPAAAAASGAAHATAPAPAASPVSRNGAKPLDDRYVPAAKLDISPLPAGNPDFAAAATHSRAGGPVVLRVYVSSLGPPDRVEVLGQPLDDEFAAALRLALEHTQFLPGRIDGHDVAAFVDYEFNAEIVALPSRENRGAT